MFSTLVCGHCQLCILILTTVLVVPLILCCISPSLYGEVAVVGYIPVPTPINSSPTTHTHTHTHTISVCDVALDMVFMLDRSGSVGEDNFDIAISFLQGVVSFFTIASNETRVCMQDFL